VDLFTAIYFLAIVIEIVIRAPIRKAQRGNPKSIQRVTRQERTLLGLLFLGMFLVPVIYAASNWLGFADYALSAWAGWLGAALLAGALFVFWRAHADLGLNWSPSLEIREKHELVTRGIYGVIAQPLLVQNWIAGWLNLLIFIPFYFLRVKAEEQLMLEQFGDQYRSYMQEVGAVFPNL